MVFFVVWQLEKLFNSTTVYFDRLFCAGISCAAVHTIMPKNERDLHSDATLIGILLGQATADNDTKCFKYINVQLVKGAEKKIFKVYKGNHIMV